MLGWGSMLLGRKVTLIAPLQCTVVLQPLMRPPSSCASHLQCDAPMKATGPSRPQPPGIRRVSYNSPPAGLEIVPIQNVEGPEEVVACRWVLEVGDEIMKEELFNYMGRTLPRLDLRSLASSELVNVGVLDAWACILNYRESLKDLRQDSLPRRSPRYTLW